MEGYYPIGFEVNLTTEVRSDNILIHTSLIFLLI
jgi:hypothetical protein